MGFVVMFVFGVALFPTTALAANPGEIWINGEDITQAQNYTVPCGSGTAVYEPSSQTVTLTNASITKMNLTSRAIDLPNGTKLEIVLNGENTIDVASNGFYAGTNSDITFSGKGSLTNTSGSAPFVSHSSVTVDGATLKVSNPSDGAMDVAELTMKNKAFIEADGLYYGVQARSLSIAGSELAATSNEAFCNAIYVYDGNLRISSNSTVTATAVSSESNPAIYAVGTISISDSTVVATCHANPIFYGILSEDTILINGDSDVTALGGIDSLSEITIAPVSGGKVDIKVGTIRFGEAGTILVDEDEIKHFEQSPYSSEVTFAGSDRLGGYTYTRIKTHAHIYDQQVVNDSYKASDATCTEPAKYYDSCVCGAKGTHTFASGQAAGHQLTLTAKVDATCTADGKEAYYTCENCNRYFSDENAQNEIPSLAEYGVLPATGHQAATAWKSDASGHWKQCVSCGEKLNEAVHALTWITDQEATATAAGSKHEQCTVCSYAKAAVELPATGDQTVPKTGESGQPQWVALLLLASIGLAGVIASSRKHQTS